MHLRYDCIVVGAGHAGCEAALALARLGYSTLLLTGNLDRIGHLSCNPAIGGLAKGHLVREIDALGGMMGLWADAAGIQFRTLNMSKGPAVRATRAQMDRAAYMKAVQSALFSAPRVRVWQDTAERILSEGGRATGVLTTLGLECRAQAVLLTTGTFLSGRIHIGMTSLPGGRLGDAPAQHLSQSLRDHGMETGRLKTGTTPRIFRSSIDFTTMEAQYGDVPAPTFSFRNASHSCGHEHQPPLPPPLPQVPCHITWTTQRTHEIISAAFDRSPLFTGRIEGTGARYCPSIEDKIARFPDRNRHQIFVEPEGLESPECYPNGISTSLPLDVQMALINSIPGLERAVMARPGYAIEYDYVNPIQLRPTLESRALPGLWLAGQINGTSGYEEAAAQGLWSACNIACQLAGKPPFLPGRDTSYMAVLVDDLVTLGTQEPYRMFTSRAEYRLLLREHNTDARLTPLGRDIGLVSDAQWDIFCRKQEALETLHRTLEHTRLTPEAARTVLEKSHESLPVQGVTPAELLRRPAVMLEHMEDALPYLHEYAVDVRTEVQTRIKYAGYLERQEALVARAAHWENTLLPEDIAYEGVHGLSAEVREKLMRTRPRTLGQARRISGVTPAAVACLELHVKTLSKGRV